jgi:hypothetical protein
MYALGYKDKNSEEVYAPTRHRPVADAMTQVSTQVGAYMRAHFPEIYKEIRDAEFRKSPNRAPLEVMGGAEGPGSCIMCSRNLGGSGHIDLDHSRSFSIWVEECPGSATNWYFILPDVFVNGKKDLAIHLFHGAVIIWDGRVIRHCRSVTNTGEKNAVHGCMFGSCR